MKKAIRIMASLLLIVLCVSGGLLREQNVKNVQAASNVKLSKSVVTLIEGKTFQLEVVGTKSKVLWKSNKKSVVTVSTKGLIKAKKAGTAVITATIDSKQYTCKITVKKAPVLVTNILTTCDSLVAPINSTFTFNTTPYPNTAANKELEWESSDNTVVSVDESGLCLALNEGIAEIYAYATDGSKVFAKWDIAVSNDFSLRVSTDMQEVTITKGETK